MVDPGGWKKRAVEAGGPLADGQRMSLLSVTAPLNRGKLNNTEFAENVVRPLPQHPALNLMTSLPEDWQLTDSLGAEVSVSEFCKEVVHPSHQRLRIRVRTPGPRMPFSVIPRSSMSSEQRQGALRRESIPEGTTGTWNEWLNYLFQPTRICSCKLPIGWRMVFAQDYVGASFRLPWEDLCFAWNRCAKPAMRPSVA